MFLEAASMLKVEEFFCELNWNIQLSFEKKLEKITFWLWLGFQFQKNLILYKKNSVFLSNVEKHIFCYFCRIASQKQRNDCKKIKYESIKEWLNNNREKRKAYCKEHFVKKKFQIQNS